MNKLIDILIFLLCVGLACGLGYASFVVNETFLVPINIKLVEIEENKKTPDNTIKPGHVSKEEGDLVIERLKYGSLMAFLAFVILFSVLFAARKLFIILGLAH